MKRTKNENLKQVLVSILVGGCVAFLSSIFDNLAILLKSHSTEIISGITSTGIYLAKAYKG
jgi:hypothetical protein